jgi:ankyrin repeat protein
MHTITLQEQQTAADARINAILSQHAQRSKAWTKSGIHQLISKLLDDNPSALEVADSSARVKLIYLAAQYSLNELVETLSQSSNDKDLALSLAAGEGSLRAIKTLCQCDANIDVADILGLTPLHMAAANGHADAIVTLLELGASQVADSDGNLPLHLAAQNGHTAAALALCNDSSILSEHNLAGNNPFDLALIGNHQATVEALNSQTLKSFLSEFADSGQSANHLDRSGIHNAIASFINSYNANIANEQSQLTLLHIAANYGFDDLVEQLINKGAEPNATTISGFTPMHMAAYHGNESTVSLLAHKGAFANSLNKDGNSPLHLAAAQGQKATALTLLKNGADLAGYNVNGNTALAYALIGGHSETAIELLNQGASKSTIIYANGKTKRLQFTISEYCVKKQLNEVLDAIGHTDQASQALRSSAVSRSSASSASNPATPTTLSSPRACLPASSSPSDPVKAAALKAVREAIKGSVISKAAPQALAATSTTQRPNIGVRVQQEMRTSAQKGR